MAATRRPRRETQAETRRHLLDAAARLFEERGFHGTSVAEIARAAGYTTGAIYANFERKEDLAMAVLERSVAQAEVALTEVLAVRGDLATRLLAVIRWRRAQPDLDPFAILRYELWLLALRDPPLRADLTAAQRRLQTDFARLLDQQAADLGVSYRVDTSLLAGALLAAADGTSVAHALDPAGQHQEAYAWALASLVVNAMEPPPIDGSDWAALAAALLDTAGDKPVAQQGEAGSIPEPAPR